ncbi:MAG: low affinity iron permease family protein [Flavobacterium sp.]|nr:low affinity iron permease family protein [Flavobacterium sp.]
MIKHYQKLDKSFERTTSIFTRILGNPITFILAFILVVFWLTNIDYQIQTTNDIIRDYVYGLSFLTLFIIQKSFNHFSASLHIKINELLASNDMANNEILNIEAKTEHEIIELKKEYIELANQIKEDLE